MYQEDDELNIPDSHYSYSDFDIHHLPQTSEAMMDFQYYEPSTSTPPLNLKLSVTNSLVQEINQKLEPSKISQESMTAKVDSDQDKCKACNFPATYVQIGRWNKTARHDMDIIIKFYFKKKKLAVEALDGNLKTKLEVKFQDIAAIRFLNLHTSNEGVLEILLDVKPIFFRETNPKPKKHTVWVASQDFTDGQASFSRKHILRFNPGSLEKLYKRIAAADSKLASLTSQPFLTDENPCFDQDLTQISFQNPQQNDQQDYFHCSQQPILQTGYPVSQVYSHANDYDQFQSSSSLVPQHQLHSDSYNFVEQPQNYYSMSTNEPIDFTSEIELSEYSMDQQTFNSDQFSSFQGPFSVAPLPSSGFGIPYYQGENTYGYGDAFYSNRDIYS